MLLLYMLIGACMSFLILPACIHMFGIPAGLVVGTLFTAIS